MDVVAEVAVAVGCGGTEKGLLREMTAVFRELLVLVLGDTNADDDEHANSAVNASSRIVLVFIIIIFFKSYRKQAYSSIMVSYPVVVIVIVVSSRQLSGARGCRMYVNV